MDASMEGFTGMEGNEFSNASIVRFLSIDIRHRSLNQRIQSIFMGLLPIITDEMRSRLHCSLSEKLDIMLALMYYIYILTLKVCPSFSVAGERGHFFRLNHLLLAVAGR
jgi:hypothetical protein